MRVERSILALVLLARTGGWIYNSNYPNVANWDAAAVQQPQRVRFFYGYVIDARTMPVVYNSRAQNWEPQGGPAYPDRTAVSSMNFESPASRLRRPLPEPGLPRCRVYRDARQINDATR